MWPIQVCGAARWAVAIDAARLSVARVHHHRRLAAPIATRAACFLPPHFLLRRIRDPRGWDGLWSSDRSPSSPRAGRARSWSTTVYGARGQRSNPSFHWRATEHAPAPCSPLLCCPQMKASFDKPSLTVIRSRNHIEGGDWTEENIEQSFIQQAVLEGDTVLEIGANIGRSTIVAAESTGPHVRTLGISTP